MIKVTSVETIVVNAKLRNWVFVKVQTNVPGLYGWGEASLEWKTRAVVGAVEDLSALIVGQDALRTEHLWQLMHRGHFFEGGVVGMSALSGIDQALWDIKAKHLGVPCWQLLGGAVRRSLRMYDHLGGGNPAITYGPVTTERFAEAAMKSVADGFSALKILAVPMGGPIPNRRQIKDAAAVLAAVRDAVGDEVDIMIDLHGRTNAAAAIEYGLALAEFHPWFFEEPCQPGNMAEMAEVARRLPFPVATGERLIEAREFRDHLSASACAILQPDVCHVGGPTAVRKIAAIAETYHVSLAPHNPLGPIATLVNQHLGFATENFVILEVMRADVPWRNEVCTGTLPIVEGQVLLPDVIGWGVEIVESEAKRHPYEPELSIDIVRPDGSVADW